MLDHTDGPIDSDLFGGEHFVEVAPKRYNLQGGPAGCTLPQVRPHLCSPSIRFLIFLTTWCYEAFGDKWVDWVGI